jgi:GTPase SAR1 family protein
MMMALKSTPRGNRLHIALFGRRNVGKSSLVNAVAGQPVSIVSETAGTTTDPVEKPMELLPIGPVVLIDTAGLDDVGALGAQRIERAGRSSTGPISPSSLSNPGAWTDFEERLLEELHGARDPSSSPSTSRMSGARAASYCNDSGS